MSRISIQSAFSGFVAVVILAGLAGCNQIQEKPYGVETPLEIPGHRTESWAVAPAVNLSGHRGVDSILQADLLFQQLQQVHGMTVVPVDRMVQVFEGLNIDRIETFSQAAMICDL